ncbi:hypothetical protein DPMN_035394 [Dreissena polymorpha]|uniref:Uncharacterized protein n=1 Tax=Dreissena polymorpha TaxID=45954 RepID=A0A9D4M9E8_DREPO|nr:hypothetical protein DPMN_035394 [Dreissena polymorpha]
MMSTLSLFLCVVILMHSSDAISYFDHIQNYLRFVSAYILDGHDTINFPPLKNASDVMKVNVGFYLYAVNGFDEVAGNIQVVAALAMSWRDEMSTIHSITYNIKDRKDFLVPYDNIWRPKLVLTTAIGETTEVGDISYICRYNMETGTVTWKPRIVISSSCTPDVTYYPFDKQVCRFVYTPWGFRSDEVRLVESFSEWNLDQYGESGEWNIGETSTRTFEADNSSFIEFEMTMTRKPLYFAFNIILPVLVLCLLNSTVFLLPAESGERVGFSVTCFLSFMVVLNMIMDIMPRSSSPISYLCFYLVIMMSNSGGMTLVTILMMRVYHKPEKSTVPIWLQRTVTFINCGCAKLRCCVLCCRALRRECCCEDKRKCGCRNPSDDKSTEDTLIEITVNPDLEIIENEREPIKKTIVEETEKSPCCFVAFKRMEKNEGTSCCGCLIGVRKCNCSFLDDDMTLQKKGSQLKGKKTSLPEKDATQGLESEGVSCFGSNQKIRQDISVEIPSSQNSVNSGETVREMRALQIGVANKNKEKRGICFPMKHVPENDELDNQTTYNTKVMSRKKSPQKRHDNTPSTKPDLDADVLPEIKQNEVEKKKLDTKDALRTTTRPGISLFNIDKEDDIPQNEVNIKTLSQKLSETYGKMIVDEEENDPETTDPIKDKEKGRRKTFKLLASQTTSSGLRVSVKEPREGNEKALEDTSFRKTIRSKKQASTKLEDVNATRERSDPNLSARNVRPGGAKNAYSDQSESSDTDTVDNTNQGVPDIIKTARKGWTRVQENLPKTSKSGNVIVPLSKIFSNARKLKEEEADQDADSLADLEEDVEWAEVGRILDTFFFLAFSGGQAFFTIAFLLPIFTYS